jgi:aminoglycoside phosphotransferase (APT) family kinase protein
VTRLHDDELDVDEELVRRLLGTLSTAYDGLPLRRFDASGSTNALFRLGDDLLVRLPRQPAGTETIEKEQRWLPYVAPHLPVPVPEVVAVGEPGFGYPEKWSVVRFLHGDLAVVPVNEEPPRQGLASDLAAVVAALGGLEVPRAAVTDPALRWYRVDHSPRWTTPCRRTSVTPGRWSGIRISASTSTRSPRLGRG